MNLLILTLNSKNRTTGGQKFDYYLYNKMQNLDNKIKISYSDDIISCKNKYLYSFFLIFKLNKILRFDFIYINSSLFPKVLGFLFIIALLGKKKKLTSIVHHYTYENIESKYKRKIYKIIEYISIHLCENIILVSPYMKDRFKDDFPNKKIIYLGLAFPRVKKEKEIIKSKYYNLLYVGTIEPRKGIEYLIKSIYLLPESIKENVKLNIVGKIVSDSYKKKLDLMISAFKINQYITFTGRISDEQLNTLYQSSKLFVFPSLLEGFGIVLIEAMSYKLPVIAFNNSAIPYTVKSRINGFICNNKDYVDFSNKIALLINDQNLYNQLSEGAFNTYIKSRSYSDLDKDIQQYINTIKLQ